MNMSSVRHGDLKAMRSFIDHLSAHTRALSTLGVSSESLSSLLLPMVKGNIPEDWRLEWARRSSHHFDDFLVFLKEEIRFGSAADLRSGEPREWAYTERPNGDYRYYERRHFGGVTDSYLDSFTNLDKTVYGRLCPPPAPCQSWWLPFSQVNIR
ncbi:hypothetical protein FJT64_002498 [Amphibalanus amphitrite]|uniref:Uncharacterized protein n=1 Tax=Amphibalanus amphitrite TaxID=1232801 RepID=A0A6A4WG95_AMPAM|nr:hypothetical protein FJT64_002498 [Amphibalanus amphitrite]